MLGEVSVLAALIFLAIGCGLFAAGLRQRFPMYLRDGQMRFYEAFGGGRESRPRLASGQNCPSGYGHWVLPDGRSGHPRSIAGAVQERHFSVDAACEASGVDRSHPTADLRRAVGLVLHDVSAALEADAVSVAFVEDGLPDEMFSLGAGPERGEVAAWAYVPGEGSAVGLTVLPGWSWRALALIHR